MQSLWGRVMGERLIVSLHCRLSPEDRPYAPPIVNINRFSRSLLTPSHWENFTLSIVLPSSDNATEYDPGGHFVWSIFPSRSIFSLSWFSGIRTGFIKMMFTRAKGPRSFIYLSTSSSSTLFFFPMAIILIKKDTVTTFRDGPFIL